MDLDITMVNESEDEGGRWNFKKWRSEPSKKGNMNIWIWGDMNMEICGNQIFILPYDTIVLLWNHNCSSNGEPGS